MIIYPLACDSGHEFEGWFASAQACDQQAEAGQIQCPSCSSAEVRKLPAAPHIHTSGGEASPARSAEVVRHQAVAELRRFILASTEDVGRKFAEIARRIHYREEEERSIRGVATPQEAPDLRDEGIEALIVSPEVIPPGELH
ncbi:MAG TPA: DUF1178 family protein [Usitatibacter sp.]